METANFIESYQTEQYDFCDKVINRLEEILQNEYVGLTDQEKKEKGFMLGSEIQQSNRLDYSVEFHSIGDPLCAQMNNILTKYVRFYGEKYTGFSQLPCFSQHMKVQKTPPKGGFHVWHSEWTSHDNAAYRSLAWTLYLNDIPDGEGETEFLEYGIKVKPKKGLLCFFPAGWTHVHRGNPVYSCDKYIATGWYYLT
jgi:hypothetical protein